VELDQKTIEDILDALFRMERMLQRSDRAKLLAILDTLASMKFKDFRDAVEYLQHTELDMRMARLRIQAATGLQPPSLIAEKDNTPVEPLLARRRSSATIPAAQRPEIPPPRDPKNRDSKG
jgi:hypothetical protein